MNDAQIKYMVGRFLCWRLPADFQPDAGISFKRVFNEGTPYQHEYQPIGTNLFDASQAEVMIRHLVEGLPVEGVIVSREWVERANIRTERIRDAVAVIRKEPPGTVLDTVLTILLDLPEAQRKEGNP